MGLMRQNSTTKHFTVFHSGPWNGTSDAKGEPVMSLISRDGVLQKLPGYQKGDWAVHIYESQNPIVSTDITETYGKRPYYHRPAYGYHYVLAVDDGTKQDSSERWSHMLVGVQDRMRWMYEQKKVGYVAIFAEATGKSGAIVPRLQMVSFQNVPPVIIDEGRTARVMEHERGLCTICQSVGNMGESRIVFKTKHFTAFCPWAPSRPYELWIAPAKHRIGFLRMSQTTLEDLSDMLRSVIGGMTNVLSGSPYSMAFHLSPERSTSIQEHWHIEIYPSTSIPTGMDNGFGITLCSISAEDAATELGAASRREWSAIKGIEE